VDSVLVTAAHLNCPAEDAHGGFTNITLRDSASITSNQWGDRIKHFRVLDLLRNCYIYTGPTILVRKITVGGDFEQGNQFAYRR
jgi:hypothetical protein